MGLASWLGRISREDAVLVTMLRKAGAVIYASMKPNVCRLIVMLITSRNQCPDDIDDARNSEPVSFSPTNTVSLAKRHQVYMDAL